MPAPGAAWADSADLCQYTPELLISLINSNDDDVRNGWRWERLRRGRCVHQQCGYQNVIPRWLSEQTTSTNERVRLEALIAAPKHCH